MKLRFFNARILSMEEGMEIAMGEVWTEDKRILYAGPSAAKQEICRKTSNLTVKSTVTEIC